MLVALAATLLSLADSRAAGAQGSAVPAPAPVRAKAWVLADAGTGVVIDESNARVPLPPASLTKLLTAVVAVAELDADAVVPVSERAAAMPARKLNMKAGEEWPLGDALHALLLSSANDAAAALAERVGGSLEGFGAVLHAGAERLGLEDDPVLRDPAGFDDAFSVDGGNLISARDMAIVARAAMAEPALRSAVALREYQFTGPDGIGHRLVNHNRLLRLYPGTIGMKTGYTRKAGNTFAAAATRDGRTMLVVLLGAEDMYNAAAALLDRGFAAPAGLAGAAGAAVDRLPAVRRLSATPPLVDTAGAGAGLAPTTAEARDGGAGAPGPGPATTAVIAIAGTVCVLRIRARRLQARRRRARRRPMPPRPAQHSHSRVPVRRPRPAPRTRSAGASRR